MPTELKPANKQKKINGLRQNLQNLCDWLAEPWTFNKAYGDWTNHLYESIYSTGANLHKRIES
jgi:predicted phosphoadenosine phosphosulfate sulfurtransferase